MSFLAALLLLLVGVGALAYHRLNLKLSVSVIATGLVVCWLVLGLSFLSFLALGLLVGVVSVPLLITQVRQQEIVKPVFKMVKAILPPMSETERTALEAGTTWWDSELFTGAPDWTKLVNYQAPQLSAEERAFIDGPVQELCAMIDDWQISKHSGDLSPETWAFLREKKFFGMIIPKSYGGLEFSALAHSEILTKIASRSVVAASIVSVPNSLGPAELLHRYGTEEQKNYYLPKLAVGEEIPCFGLTNPWAGSDATAIPDEGIVCQGTWEGKKVLGIKLNWDKRYITLAPIATVLGLAFQLKDPNHLLPENTVLGITCALIPTTLKGITIGNRHLPLNAPFQNGPTQGKDVFIPLDFIIGGPKMAGQGWRMLVECLSTGRAISLPSSASGGARVAAFSAGAYARVRKQFNQPIGRFEGIAEVLANMAGYAYINEAARQLTATAIDQGEAPSVLGAIVKYHVTEQARQISMHAMDVLAGKAVIMGPRNHIANGYINAPVGVTVEGANILTRNLIIFGQGAMRCHPYVMLEMQAAAEKDEYLALQQFDEALMGHIGFSISNLSRSLFMGLSGARLVRSPIGGAPKRAIQQLNHAASSFAFMADACMLVFGGKLKFKERLSARLGDLLSMLYLGSCVVKRFLDQGKNQEDIPFLEWSIAYVMGQFWQRMDEILDNMPQAWLKWSLKLVVMPLGKPVKGPSDELSQKLSQLMQSPSTARSRLVEYAYLEAGEHNPAGIFEEALVKVIKAEPIEKRIFAAVKEGRLEEAVMAKLIKSALSENIINTEEARIVEAAEAARYEVITVDDFAPEALFKMLANKTVQSKQA